MSTTNTFSEALALANLIAEATGCTTERALAALATLSTGGPPLPTPKVQKATGPIPDPIVDYVSGCPVGAEFTVEEIYSRCGLQYPRGGKRLPHFLMRNGWTINGAKINGRRVYHKN